MLSTRANSPTCVCAQQHCTRKPFPSKEVGIDCIRHSRDTSLQGLDPQVMSCSVVKSYLLKRHVH